MKVRPRLNEFEVSILIDALENLSYFPSAKYQNHVKNKLTLKMLGFFKKFNVK